ncbi:hypothetical protein ABPG74_000527 [Tetrahymena malaccensis]
MKFNPDIYYQMEENLNENFGFLDQSFSLMITLYQYVIYIPSIVSSLDGLGNNPASYALLSVAVLLNIIISDTDYNYQIKVKDYLAKPFSFLNFTFKSLLEIFILATIMFIPQGESIILSCYLLINGLNSYFFAYYFEEFSQLLDLFIHITLICMSTTLQICISYNISNKILSYLFIIYIPFSYKIASLIIERDRQNLINDFQQLYEQKQNENKNIDRIIRLNIFDSIENSKQNEKRYLKFLNLISNSNKLKQTKFMNSKKENDQFYSNFQKEDLFYEFKVRELQNQLQFQSNNQQQAVLFDDVSLFKLIQKKIINILRDSFMKTSDNKLRNKQNGTQSLLNLFIFLIEISQSHRMYFLKKELYQEREWEELTPLTALTYKQSFLRINWKDPILYCASLLIQNQCMQAQIKQLKINLNHLIQLNDDSLDLLNLQALFLENLSFSEKDINIVQVNKYARKQNKNFNQPKEDEILSSIINNDKFDEKTCIIFISYQDTKKLLINQVSSNFFNLFYQTNKENIQGKYIESIIPLQFQTAHNSYIKQYLSEEITTDIYSNDFGSQNRSINQLQSRQNKQIPFGQKQDFQFDQQETNSNKETSEDIFWYQSIGNKMNQQIIFASLNQMFILPVKIDIRTNEFKENDTFGLVAKVKQINQEYQYVLFNEIDLSVIGLTEQLHEIFFPHCENLQKINLRHIFPFLISAEISTKSFENREEIKNNLNGKNKLHVNLSDDIEDFLKDQIKNQFKKKNKLAFVVIQNLDMINITQNSSLICSKKKINAKKINKMKSKQDISSYCFTYVELILKKLNYRGINNISYIEIAKIRQLNPFLQAPIILQEITNLKKQQIYSQLFSSPQEFQNILFDLEQLAINYHPTDSLDSQLNLTSRDQNQQQLINDNNRIDKCNNISKLQQQLLKSQTIGDESTNLEQIKIKKNKIDNEEGSCQGLEYFNQQFNQQFIEQDQIINNKNCYKFQNNFHYAQSHQIQNINTNTQDNKFISSLQEIQQMDYEECEEDLSRVKFAFKDLSMDKTQDDHQQFNKNFTLLSPSKSDKALNIELISPANSSYMHIFPKQQSITNLSYQDLKSLEFKYHTNKEISQQDLDCNKNSSRQMINKSNTYIKKIKEKGKTHIQSDRYQKDNPSRLANALSLQHQQQQKNQFGFDKYGNRNLKDKYQKKKQIQDIQYDIASTNSRDSSSASAKRQLCQIMADKSILQVIKAIKIIGIVCFAAMICMTWVQFISMEKNLRESNLDYQVFNWPTTYSSSLSDILKYKNTQYLIQFSRQLQFQSIEQRYNFYNRLQSDLELTLAEVYELLSDMSKANSDRMVFKLIRETQSFYIFGQLYNSTLLTTTPSNSVELFSFNYNTNLLTSIFLGVQLTFRYTHNLGNGRPEYYLIQNQLSAISQLQKVQNDILVDQQNDQEYIQDQLGILIVVLVIISAICVAIIIPLYFYIQKERDSIIYLLTTFPTFKLDNLIKKIQNSYINQNIESIYQSQNNHQLLDSIVSYQVIDNDRNIRKQNISSITKLPRFNKSLIIFSFFIYLLMVCYPIIVRFLTQDYLNKTTIDLQTMMKVYYLRSFLLQNIAMHFNILTMKVNPRLKPMQPEIYYEYLATLIKQEEDIYNDIQWITKSQYQNSRFNQEEYDDFFFSAFKGNLCDNFRSYPQYNTNTTRIDVNICTQSQQGFLSQGLQIAYKSLFNFFNDLYSTYMIEDQAQQQQQIQKFLSAFDIQDFIAFTEFLDETIISLNEFILTQGNNYYMQIKILLIALISFQMVLMVLIFTFGWISFTNYLNNQLLKTKNYLQILDVNTLIESPYILTYIKKNVIV